MLEAVIQWSKYLSYKHDDDNIDRLHYFFTSNVLIALGILVSWKQFGGKPIECLVPAKFPGAWEQTSLVSVSNNYDTDFVDDLNRSVTFNILLLFSVLTSFKLFSQPIECSEPEPRPHSSFQDYTENYCWAQDTYFLPFDEQVPKEVRDREDKQISYYQWVPFFLLIEAACFRLPSLIWQYLAHHSGIKIHDIVKLAVDPQNVDPEVKKSNIASLTVHLQNALRFHRRVNRKQIMPHKILRFLNIPYSAFFVTTMYLVTKLAYILNVAVQLYLMNRFLETDKYTWYGFGALRDLMNGSEWQTTGTFPRVTICDFQVRVMGNVQRYSVQCVLVINIFNEKIFIFLWFWYVILFVLTSISFVYWFFVAVMPCPKMNFVRRHLELSDMPFDSYGSRMEMDRFVNRYLKLDGVFVLRMITMHSGVIFGTDLVLSLWKAFYGIDDSLRRGTAGAIAITPTPPAGNEHQQRHLLNFLRHRKKAKTVGTVVSPTKQNDTKAHDDDVLTRQLLPPTDEGAGDKVPLVGRPPPLPKKPTAPSAVTVDLPPSRNPSLGMAKKHNTIDDATAGDQYNTARANDSDSE